jgi:hypothetical protein
MARRHLACAVSIFALALAGCDKAQSSSPAGAPTSSNVAPTASMGAAAPVVVPLPQQTLDDPNPLRLPPRKLKLDPGRRVFTFADRMLAGAKLGSTLVLYAATVTGFDGDELIIEGRTGPNYKVHAGYVIPVPDEAGIRVGDAVLTEWNLAMKHAVVTKIAKGVVTVRYTDMDAKTPEGHLKAARFIRQADGLAPGNYAALRDGADWKHVLLVSPANDDDRHRWFALGFGGAALIADEADLRPIPVKFNARVGAEIWAEWVGTMRKATVQSTDDPALFTVRYERAGRPAVVGWGLLMKPLEGS